MTNILVLIASLCLFSAGFDAAEIPQSLPQLTPWRFEEVGIKGAQEKLVGRLWYKKKEVIGQLDDRINTDVGVFMWRPQRCDLPQCGWYRINPQKKYPRWRIVVIDESEKEPLWHPVPRKPF
jgi:hypothetical protein